ncbi:MAG: 23S rRNA (guanosine(2251)-2'-O)-methyltransferase RlmB [Bacteroidales bacterium]|jgi:23S rRNA (guanosine2251-2'-O)-methyltransferase|nr:23S rRNA (guanosine(2251)-2'-O)-methyltransferase RlmB [Bacteroidales bacterium]
MKESQLIYGIRPVLEALKQDIEIDKVFLLSSLQGNLTGELKTELKKKNIIVQHVPIEKLDRMTKSNHQGVVALMSVIKYSNFFEIIDSLLNKEEEIFILMLDRLTDVRNFGAIARTALCAGVNAIVIPQHNSAQINEDAIKTSAGALLNIPICKEGNLKTAINYAKQMGIKVYAATEKDSKLYTKSSFKGNTMIVLGSEESGIATDIIRLCDEKIGIPLKGNIESLNVSVAAGIIMYEVVRQRTN